MSLSSFAVAEQHGSSGVMLTQWLQQGPCSSAGEHQHKVALGIDIEVRVARHIRPQHKFPHFVRLPVKQNVQSPASHEDGAGTKSCS